VSKFTGRKNTFKILLLENPIYSCGPHKNRSDFPEARPPVMVGNIGNCGIVQESFFSNDQKPNPIPSIYDSP